MKSFRLRIAAILGFSSFAAASGAFASTGEEAAFSTEDAPRRMDSGERLSYAEEST
jgi:hypothetical protein